MGIKALFIISIMWSSPNMKSVSPSKTDNLKCQNHVKRDIYQ